MANNVIQILVAADDQASGPLNQIATGALRSLGEVAVNAAGQAAQALAGFAADSIKAAGDFQANMNVFASVTGSSLAASGKSLDDFKQLFLSLGAELPVSTAEVQQAAIELAKGGIEPATIAAGGLRTALDLAAAGGVGLAESATILSKQLGVWVAQSADAATKSQFMAQAANLLSQAANASTVDVDELALGLANVGGIAKASGVGFQDLVTTMAAIAPGFSSAADAGTSLKTFLSRLQPTTQPAIDAMKQLGLITASGANQFYDASGSLKSMDQVAQLLQGSLAGLSDAQKTAALQAIFGADSFRVAAILADQGAAGIQNMASAMASAGSVQEQAAARQQGFNVALDNFKGSVESLQITIGSALLPILTQLFNTVLAPAVNTVTTLANAVMGSKQAFDQLSPTLQLVASTLQGWIAAFSAGGLVGGLDAIIASFTGLTGAVDPLVPVFEQVVSLIGGNLTPILVGLAAVVGGALLSALAGIVGAFLAAAAPILLLVAAAAALYAAWQSNFLGIRDVTMTVLGALGGVVTSAIGVITGALQTQGAGILATVSATWTAVTTTIGGVLGGLAAVVASIFGVIAGFVAQYGPQITSTLGGAFQQLGAIVQTAAAIIQATVVPVLQGIAAFITAHAAQIQNVLGGAWQVVASTIQGVLGIIQGVLSAVLAAIQGDWAGAWAGLTSAVQAAWDGVVGILQGGGTILLNALSLAFDGVLAIISAALAPIAGVVQAAWDQVTSVTSAAWSGVAAVVGPALDAVGAVVQAGASAVVTVLQAIWNTVALITSTAWNALTSVVGPPLEAIAGVVAGAAGAVVAALSAAWDQVTAVTSTAWTALSGVVDGAITAVIGIVQGVIATIVSTVSGGWAEVESTTAGPWQSIQAIIDGAWAAISAAVSAGVAAVQAVMSGAWSVVVAAANNDFGSIPGIIQGTWDKVKSVLASGVEAVKGAAAGMASAAVSLGKSIVDGIISGVSGAAGALASKIKDMAKGALDAAKNALGIHSPSQAFMQQVGIPIVDGIVAGISGASPKAVTAVLELAGKLVDVVAKGVDAFGKLRNLGEIPNSAITAFVGSLNTALAQFANVAATWDKAAISWASQFQAKAGQVVDMLAKGVDFLSKLRELGPIAPDAAGRLAAGIDAAMRAIVAISNRQTLIALAGAQAFAKVAGDILSILKTGVDAIAALQNLVDPPAGSIQRFAQFASWLVLRFAQIGTTLQGPALGAASAFAEGAGKILAILKTGVEGLAALNTLADPVPGIFLKFASQISLLVMRLGQVADSLGQTAVDAAARFAESAGKVLAILKTGVEGLTALRSLQAVPAEALQVFAAGLRQVVSAISAIAQQFAADAVAAAAKFAESAGKILSILKSGVDGLSALADVQAVPAAAIERFAAGVEQIVTAIGAIAQRFSAEGLKAASAFAESAGKVLGVIKSGVDGLAALAQIQPASASGIDAFVANVNLLVTKIAAAASGFSTDALAAAGKFADAAAKAVGMLKTGVEGFYQVDTFAGVSEAAIQRFADGVKLAVDAMVRLAGMFTADALAAAKTFADVAQQSVDFLKKGAEGFDRLGEMKVKPGTGLDAFATGIQQLVATMIRLSQAISTDALTEAQRLAVGLDNILTVVTGSIKAFKDLADQIGAGDLGKVTNGLAPAAANLIAGMKAVVIPGAENLGASVLPAFVAGLASTTAAAYATFRTVGQNIAIGMANGITAGAPAIQNAVIAAINAAIAAAKAALGIASPSKVFDAMGRQTGAGMVGGMQASVAPVAAAGGRLAGAAISGARTPTLAARSPSLLPGGSRTTNSQAITIAEGAITIHPPPGQDPAATAAEVLRQLRGLVRGRPF